MLNPILFYFLESVSFHQDDSRNTLNDTKQENTTGAPVKLFTGKNTHDATQYRISAYIYLYKI